jgi:hypothetical protein
MFITYKIMKTVLLISTIIIATFCNCREKPKKVSNSDNFFFGMLPMPYVEKKEVRIKPADSLFVYQGISSSEIVENSVYDFYNLFVDSTKKRAYLKLDNKSKLKLLTTVLKMDTIWIKEDIQAFLISKQEKIGNIQPIIIQTLGTDFDALLLVNLDQKGNFVFGTFLNGGENGGPLSESDSLVICRPYIRCFFVNNHIKSYSLNAMIKDPNHNNIAIIDSINFESTIELDGTIKTQKLDSFRYKRIYNW